MFDNKKVKHTTTLLPEKTEKEYSEKESKEDRKKYINSLSDYQKRILAKQMAYEKLEKAKNDGEFLIYTKVKEEEQKKEVRKEELER